MADPTDPAPTAIELIAELQERVKELARLQFEHQAVIVALVAYQRELPACDVARLSALIEEQRTRLKLPPRAADLDASLQALLRDFEGPPQ